MKEQKVRETEQTYGSDYTDYQLKRSLFRKIIRGFYLRNIVGYVRGPTLDLGCGTGELLRRLPPESLGLEVNAATVDYCRQSGLNVELFKPEQDNYRFAAYRNRGFKTFTSIHVLEHLADPADVLIRIEHFCSAAGIENILIVVPGPLGYKSDATHRTFIDLDFLRSNRLLTLNSFYLDSSRHFPFPLRAAGNYFTHNELLLDFHRRPDRTEEHSFAILAYKKSPYLEECIRSLKNQKALSTIYIATSTPSHYIDELAKKYGIKVYVNSEQKGIAADWNFALSQCQTPFVTLAHQDDIYESDYSAAILSSKRLNDSQIIFTDYGELTEEGVRSYTINLLIKKGLRLLFLFRRSLGSRFFRRLLISFGSPIPCPAVTYNLARLKDFRFAADFSINMDWEAWIRLAESPGHFTFIKRRLMLHRIHPESETTQGIFDSRRQNEDERLFRALWPRPLAKLLSYFYFLSYRSNSK